MKRLAVYPGSFNPLTNGHLDILRRSLKIFDEVIILLAINPEKGHHVFTKEDCLYILKEATKDFKNVRVDSWDNLTVDYCRKVGAKHLIRGLRAVSDFEYEFQLAAANSFLDEELDMVFFMAKKEETFISSSTIDSLYRGGADISSLVPPVVLEMYKKRYPR